MGWERGFSAFFDEIVYWKSLSQVCFSWARNDGFLIRDGMEKDGWGVNRRGTIMVSVVMSALPPYR